MPITRRRRRRQPDPRSDAPAGSDKLATIRELCSFERRLTGTDAERRAANAMASRLREGGRRAEIEPTYVHPQAPLVWALHCLLAFAGSLVAIEVPAAGFAIILVAATSFYLDLNSQRHLLRFFFFRRASQNVVSRGRNAGAAGTIILSAHLDTARTGFLFGPRQMGLARRLSGWLPFPHTRLLFWSAAALLPIVGARMAGVDTDGLSLLQLIPTLALLVAVFVLVEWQLSSVAPGANDNASGVAVALSAAARLQAEPVKNVDVWVLLTGAEESGMEGMRSFARARRGELDKATTLFVSIDSVGKGDVRWTTSEGMTISFDMDPRLIQLCEAVGEADREGEGRYRAGPLRHGYATDALAARAAGWRAIAVSCLEPGEIAPAGYHSDADTADAIDPAALDRAEGFVVDLVRAVDRDLARVKSPARSGDSAGSGAGPRRRRGRRKRSR